MLDKLKKSGFVRNTFILISGTVIAQLIPIALQPILRRVYAVEDFGVMAVYLSTFGILSVIASGRYEMAIVLPEKDEDAKHLLFLSFIINGSFSLLLFLCVLLFKTPIIEFMAFPEPMYFWIYFIPLSVFLFSSYRTMNYWLVRKKKFRAASYNKVFRRGGEGSVQLGMGWMNMAKGLLSGVIVGKVFYNITCLFQLLKSGFTFRGINKGDLKKVAREFKDYPLYNAGPALLNILSLQLPILLINGFFSEEYTGYFDLSKQMLTVPISLISVSLSQVLMQDISERRIKSKPIKKHFFKISGLLLLIAVVGGSIILLWGEDLFTFIFGEEWLVSGEIAQILIFSLSLKFIVNPLSVVLNSLNRIRITSLWQIAYFGSICLLFLFREMDFFDFMKVYVLIELILYSLHYLLIVKEVNRYEKGRQ